METSVTMTARERVRAELTQEIKEAARRHLTEHGSAALSLRAVARDVGMVSSAVYRYFPSRDDLLTALIIDAYGAVGAAAAAADEARRPADIPGRWLAIARAVRGWAGEHPAEYALVYGSPVPGYRAPQDTIAPAAQVSLVLMGLLRDGVANGTIATGGGGPIARAIRHDLAGLRAEVADLADVPDEVLLRGLAAWAQLFGSISLELFGHLHNVIFDYDGLFDHQMRAAGRLLVGG